MFYVLDDDKNKVEALSKEDVYALLEQAIEDGDLSHIEADSAFVSKLKSIINGSVHHVEFVTQAQFNSMQQGGTLVAGTYYFITDDTTAEDLGAAIDDLSDEINSTNARITNLDAENRKKADAIYRNSTSGRILVYDHGSTGTVDVSDYMKAGKTATDIIAFVIKVRIETNNAEVLEEFVNVICYNDGASTVSFFGVASASSTATLFGEILGASLDFVFEDNGGVTTLETTINEFYCISKEITGSHDLMAALSKVYISGLSFLYK